MADHTALDAAHAAMAAAPRDDAARLAFYAQLAATELFVLLAEEARGDSVTPRLLEAEGHRFALSFDNEERLAGFTAAPAPYAALSGRALASMLAPAGLGLGLNLEVAPSAILLPPEAMAWLAESLAEPALALDARPQEFLPPGDLPESLLRHLDARLAAAGGLASHAWLVAVRHMDGTNGHLLAIIDAKPEAEAFLVRTLSEAARFSERELVLEIGFFAAGDPVVARLARVGLRFDLPQPTKAAAPQAPGTDPARPPRLR